MTLPGLCRLWHGERDDPRQTLSMKSQEDRMLKHKSTLDSEWIRLKKRTRLEAGAASTGVYE